MNFTVLTSVTPGNFLYTCSFYTSKVIWVPKLFQKANWLSASSLERGIGAPCCKKWSGGGKDREDRNKNIKKKNNLIIMGWMFYLNALCTAKQSLQYIFDDDVHCDRFWDVLIFSLKVCAKISPVWVEVTWDVVLVIQEESVANTHFCKGARRVGRTFTLLLQCWTGSDGLLFWYLFCGKQNICLSSY